MQRALQLERTVAGRKKFFYYMQVSQHFDFENDIVIKVGHAADLGTHYKNLKLNFG